MRRADLSGPSGRAWDVSKVEPTNPSTLAAWLVHEPHAHPAWKHFLVASITLADMVGVPTAIKRYPEAEYEFMIAALDPELKPDAENLETWRVLTPLNVVVQFHGANVERVRLVTELAVKAVINGLLPIEPDIYPGATDQWHRSIRASAGCHEPAHG